MSNHAESSWQQLIEHLEQSPHVDAGTRPILDGLRTHYQALESHNHHLTQTLREQTLRLDQQLAELNGRDRLHYRSLAVLSHELRNPVGAIRMIAELLKFHEAQFDADYRHDLEILDRQLTHLGRILDDLLDMVRLNDGQISLQKTPIALAEVVEHAVQALRPQLEARAQSLEVSLPQVPLTLDADPPRLGQALDNLLHNAVKFSGPGAIIRLQAHREGQRIRITIQDPGIGIDSSTLAHLFEPFGNRQHHHGGLGLGLALARHLIRLHGGNISAESQGSGQGSVFTVYLPVIEDDVPRTREAPTASPLAPAHEHRRRILVVDDNPDAALGLERLLVHLGHRVHTALDGPAALGLAAEFRPEVVLLDLGMPGMDGYQVARRLRADFPDWRPRLIALTGYGQEQDRQRTRQAGFDDHLIKPVDLPTLKTVLATVDDSQ